MTTPTTTHVTFADLLAVLFPSGTDGYLKLVAEGSQRSTDYWFRRGAQGWVWQRQYGWREAPETLERVLAAQEHDVRFSPVVWAAPAVGSAPLSAAAVWAWPRVAILGPALQLGTVPRLDPASGTLARQRLGDFRPEPSLIVDEGDRLVALWLLSERIQEVSQVDRALRALASALGGDCVLAGEASVAVPGTRNTRLHPAPTVEIVTWEPGRRYGVDALRLP